MSKVLRISGKPASVKVVSSENDNGGFYPPDQFSPYRTPQAAKEIEAKHQQSLQEKYEEGFQAGYEEGVIQGEKAAIDKLNQMLGQKAQELNTVLGSIEQRLIEHDESFETVVAQVSLMIAEKIICREIQEKSIIEHTIQHAVKKIVGANEVTVKLHPDDYAMILESGQSESYDTGFTKLRFEPTDKIHRGGCYLESDLGNVDARISTLIEELGVQLLSHLTPEEA